MQEHFVRNILVNFAIIGISFVVFGVALNFASRDLALQSQKTIAARSILAHRARFAENLAALKQEEADAEPLQKAIAFLLPPQETLLNFPQYLESIARVYKVNSIFNFQGNPTPASPQGVPASASSPGYVSFSLSLDGSFDALQNTLNDMESKTTRFAVTFESIDVSGSGASSHATVQGKVFFQ